MREGLITQQHFAADGAGFQQAIRQIEFGFKHCVTGQQCQQRLASGDMPAGVRHACGDAARPGRTQQQSAYRTIRLHGVYLANNCVAINPITFLISQRNEYAFDRRRDLDQTGVGHELALDPDFLRVFADG